MIEMTQSVSVSIKICLNNEVMQMYGNKTRRRN